MVLEDEKRERIINAAIKEFALKGYQNASTNEIVKEAGISKGLLFHYFSNKKTLYLFLYEYCMDILLNEVFSKIDLRHEDIFQRLRRSAVVKFGIYKRFPQIYKFALSVVQEENPEVRQEISDRVKTLKDSGYLKFFDDIDTSKFREDIDTSKAINLIIWSMDGFANNLLAKLNVLNLNEETVEKWITEWDKYSNILEKCFYKP